MKLINFFVLFVILLVLTEISTAVKKENNNRKSGTNKENGITKRKTGRLAKIKERGGRLLTRHTGIKNANGKELKEWSVPGNTNRLSSATKPEIKFLQDTVVPDILKFENVKDLPPKNIKQYHTQGYHLDNQPTADDLANVQLQRNKPGTGKSSIAKSQGPDNMPLRTLTDGLTNSAKTFTEREFTFSSDASVPNSPNQESQGSTSLRNTPKKGNKSRNTGRP